MSGNKGKQLRAATYSRTSGEGQRDNTSIPIQQSAEEAMCEKNGWKFVRHYVDECKSGAKTEGREGFKRMLQDAAKGEFDIVVPFDATRLARDGVDIVSTAKVLKSEFGVFVVDAKGQFDNRDHRNALRNFVQAGVSEHERLTIMERMLGGRIAKAKAGLQWSGNAPIGRQFRKTGKSSGEWSVTDVGRNLATLLTRYVAGESLTNLAREYGYCNPAAVMRHVREGQLAAQPYVVTFHTPEIGIINLQVPVPAVPPVISVDLERRVRDRLNHNRTWNKKCLRKYILSGFIRCAHCSAALTSGSNEGLTYYRHHPKVGDGGKSCGFHSIPGNRVEGTVLDYLYQWFVDQPAFEKALALALPQSSDRLERETELRRLECEHRQAEQGIARLVDAIASGVDPSLLVLKQVELKAERDAKRARLDELRKEIASMPDPEAIREEAYLLRGVLASDHFAKDWRQEAFEDIQRFLHFLFGDNPKKEKLGVFIRLQEGRWTSEIRARLRLRSPEIVVGDDQVARFYGVPEGELIQTMQFEERINLFGSIR